MAKDAQLCALRKGKKSVVFQEGNAFLRDLCNLLFLISVKLGGTAEITLVVVDVRTKGVALERGGLGTEEFFKNVLPTDPLNFYDTESYAERLKKAHDKTGLDEAVITGLAKINGHKIATAVMDFDYMGGSMGSVVGEKVTRIMEKALALKLPVLVITSSGGARMQESALSLMQMAKTSCAVGKLDEAGLLYINLLTEPTFGGITASFGTLGDIIIAEQGARIGFAGRRVIEQTIRQKLPDDFQTAEYLLKYGQVDIVSKRRNLRKVLTNILDMHGV